MAVALLSQGRCTAPAWRLAFAMAMAMAMSLCREALAVNYVVGDATGWTIMSYDDWKEGKTFRVGDTLQFIYTSAHDVVEVTEANYDACAKGANTVYTNGNTTYALNSTGDKYYICTVDSHCTQGMKIEVDVEAATSGTSPSSGSNSTTTGSPSSSSSLSILPSIAAISVILVFTVIFFRAS